MLRASGAGTPSLDAALFLCAAAGVDRSRVAVHPELPLGPAAEKDFRRMLGRRADGDCAAYVLGSKEFRGIDFAVTRDVLVPRPDTEILVEAALERLAACGAPNPRVLDLCTGSGCIAVAVKSEFPAASVEACDISDAALKVAASNAERVLGKGAVAFFESDLFSNARGGAYDMIISNPPYVPSAAIDGLDREVRREPRIALDGGADGLDLIRKIVAEAPRMLTGGGALLLEAGDEQADAIARLMEEAGFVDIRTRRDLSGLRRTTEGTLSAPSAGRGR